jgi:cell wall-associated NlpC family hydrolase
LQVRTVSALICSLMAVGGSASSALAASTGGVSAAEPTATAPATAKSKLHLFPVTAKSSNIAYKGPVYEKSASGEVVPYTPPPATGTTEAAGSGPAIGTAASATGGAAPAAEEATPASPVASGIPPELITGDGMTDATGPTPRPELLVPGTTARFVDGLAAAPEDAPAQIQEIIWAANEVIGLPYIYGGGHDATFISPGYDCSGTVSFALHGAALLTAPEDSSEFMVWGSHGMGRWISIFSDPEHAYMTIAGLRLDTSPANDPSGLQGPRWRPLRPSNAGYVVRHPLGL